MIPKSGDRVSDEIVRQQGGALAAAFADPGTTSQAVFRAVMDAMARPGSVQALHAELTPPAPLSAGAGAVALALLDYETPFWLDPPLVAADVAQWLRFHTGAPVAQAPDEAAFAFFADAAQAELARFALGTPDYPDRSTTLVLQVAGFGDGLPLRLAGPGIQGEQVLRATPLPADIVAQLAANRALFPRGVDLVLASLTQVAALPRSVRVGD